MVENCSRKVSIFLFLSSLVHLTSSNLSNACLRFVINICIFLKIVSSSFCWIMFIYLLITIYSVSSHTTQFKIIHRPTGRLKASSIRAHSYFLFLHKSHPFQSAFVFANFFALSLVPFQHFFCPPFFTSSSQVTRLFIFNYTFATMSLRAASKLHLWFQICTFII